MLKTWRAFTRNNFRGLNDSTAQRKQVSSEERQRAFVQPVHVGMLKGALCSGRIGPFSPFLPNLLLLKEDDGVYEKVYIAAEKIAYVGFGHDDNAPDLNIELPSSLDIRVHVSGGEVFAVTVSRLHINDAQGFWGVPYEKDSPFKGMYFYANGINAKESVELLGEMLIEDGALGDDLVHDGVEHQHEAQEVPLGQFLVQLNKATTEEVEQACEAQAHRPRLRLGEVLIEQGLATEEDIQNALVEQRRVRGRRLGEVLVDMGVLDETALFRTLARKFHMAFVDLDDIDINPKALQAFNPSIIRKFGVLPLDITPNSMTVAIRDPLNTEAQDILRFECQGHLLEVLSTPSQLDRYIEDLFNQDKYSEVDRILELLEGRDGFSNRIEHGLDGDNEESAVVRLVDQTLIDAYRQGVSDIHIEPNGLEQNILVRFRTDGECTVYRSVPSAFRREMSARIKIMAGLDIAERRKPQDGKITFMIDSQKLELRVATIPTVGGNEDVVMRLLSSSKPIELDRMGFNEKNLRDFRRIIKRPHGLVLCVGPTGSGKTTTLHSALGYINDVATKIWTAEDPVEITQPGLRQVQVQRKIGFDFAAAMRAFLRADPDVIMIGEMRDSETANIAIEAALTGHLVFSTLHTNSAPETVTRLLDMDLDPFSFADALQVVLAQRLARALCKMCRVPHPASPEEFEQIRHLYGAEALKKHQGIIRADELQLWSSPGCSHCGQTGYKGRLALHEMMIVNNTIKGMIQEKSTAIDLREAAIAGGMTTLMQDGLNKCIAGRTEIGRVLAVCSSV